jgi:hypothetical protein
MAIGFTLTLAGCAASSPASGTTGRLVAFETRAIVKDDLTQGITNALGWSITLEAAYLSVGPLYYYAGDPVLSQRHLQQSPLDRALEVVSTWIVPSAHAHPGHYVEGAAMGQMLTPTTLDLLAGAVDLAGGDGISGEINSARFTWQSPPQGEWAAQLEGHVVLTKGVASKGDTTVAFIAKADEPEVRDGEDKPQVAGCAFGTSPGQIGVTVDRDGTVVLTLVPAVWFDQVEFSYVVPSTPGAPVPDANGRVDISGTLAGQGFTRGLKKGTAYEFSYE